VIGTRATTRMPIDKSNSPDRSPADRGFEMKGSSNPAPDPRWRDQSVTSTPATVLFRGAGITVTTAFIESAGRRYPLAQLRAFRRVEHASWLQPRMYELWARFRGELVQLFRSRDEQEFGQVCRALVRAREYAGLT
jgi:hypothetical protein